MYQTIALLTRLQQAQGRGPVLLRRALGKPAPLLLPGAALALQTLLRGQTAMIRHNMAELLPAEGRTAAEQQAYVSTCVSGFYRHAARTLYELLAAETLLPSRRVDIRLEGEHHLAEALKQGKGAILYAPHTGNFFYGYWHLSRTYPSLTVATASDPELAPLYRSFQRLGCPGLDYDKTPPMQLVRKLRHHLEGGGVLLLLGDFYRPGFPRARLLGRATRLPAGAAKLGLELGTPVVPARCVREADHTHRFVMEEPVQLRERFGPGEQADAAAFLNLLLEQQLLKNPEQWFYWFNAHERFAGGSRREGE
ncbi:lipid A biosynthesis acyltransferase [Paenibacillus mesotrionivorans]|uniref:Lipid A biosynthesis acyltransferase n=1 Tax=Paenibacillus mesotrionivorans TaxID=3160968 RepID=A0ACC7NWG4_9BACL